MTHSPRPPHWNALQKRLQRAMLRDRHRLERRLRELRRADKTSGKDLAKWIDALERSETLFERRGKKLPRPTFDDTLPVCQRRDEIAAAIRNHQVVVVCGETGSGKSTQLPKICLDLRRGVAGVIGHTQPRRIAARSVATRLAEELGATLGHDVGFKIRFTDVTRAETYVKLMTDGILLAEIASDRFLNQYDTIILDEAHERSLNIDFLIGYLKQLLPKRPELKLIITSATIDAARFAQHFATEQETPPVITVAGRTFPVETRYRPLEPDEETRDTDWTTGLRDAVDELARIDQGHILIFMPTERDIHEVAKLLRSHRLPGDADRRTQVVPLYARLPTKDQQRIFQPYKHRRIIIATNVAESSLTVPGIRYVIDVGTARISRYSARSRTQRLPIEPISQASADQRMGRCGRVGPGICIRLYSEEDYVNRDKFTTPEIQRTNLAAVILQMTSLHLGRVEEFPFLDPPRRDAVRDGYKTLFEIGALDDKNRLTPLGKRLSRLPVDPRIGRMILAGDDENCLSELLIIAAALELQDPRVRPIEHAQAADEAHAQFQHADSDFLGYLKLWDFYHGLKHKLSRSQLRKACQQNFLSYNRLREWVDVHRQLMQLAQETKLRRSPRRDDANAIHRAILTGMLTRIAWRQSDYEYTTTGSGKANLWPGSAGFESRPVWIVAAELVQTNRRYLRTCGRIQPEWVEQLGGHLVHRSHSEPHWSSASASAMAFEKVSLQGLPVVPRRRVRLGPIDPVTARELMIQHGLVEAQWDQCPPFLEQNRQVVHEIETMEHKLRRRDLMPEERLLYEFYDKRIPHDVYDGPRLLKWLKDQERERPDILRLRVSDLMQDIEALREAAAFPEAAQVASVNISLDYHYMPGAEDDGVTVTVPVDVLNHLDARRLGWLVPGLLEQKIVALIKSLPKPIRRQLVPAPNTAKRILPELTFGQGDLIEELARLLTRLLGERITPEMFDIDRLDASMKMNVRVVDAAGEAVGMGRDLAELRQSLPDSIKRSREHVADPRFSRRGITSWDFDSLPEKIQTTSSGVAGWAYPTLVDEGDSVALKLMRSREESERETPRGVRRLFALAVRRDVKHQLGWLPRVTDLKIQAAAIKGFDFERQAADLLIQRAFSQDAPIPRDAGAFQQQLTQGRVCLGSAIQDIARLIPNILQAHQQTRVAMGQCRGKQRQYAVKDARHQISQLLHPTFLTDTPWLWLQHFPRYLKAVEYRLSRLATSVPGPDYEKTQQVQAWWRRYEQKVERWPADRPHPQALIDFRWMLEEFRVSLFAQSLKTAVRVSPARLEKQWSAVR